MGCFGGFAGFSFGYFLFVAGALNNRLLDYLPQVITLLPAELLEALPLASQPLRLAA